MRFHGLLGSLLVLAACGAADSGAADGSDALESEVDAPIGVDVDVTAPPTVTMSGAEVRDRIEAAWLGQLVGVNWGWLTEFMYKGEYIPDDNLPEWLDTWAYFRTGYAQDDLYVEFPFLDVLVKHGVTAGWDLLGPSFASTQFQLWHANGRGRDNLRAGIPAPDSGHYSRNTCADDIDWQIEADFAGQLAPGLPQVATEVAWRHGHVMNFGDGVYGGVWVAALHAAAFTATSVAEMLAAGRASLPDDATYTKVLDDVTAWHQQHPTDWKVTWQLLQDKWGTTDRCSTGKDDPYNIDAKLNSAYVLMGLLYGEGDFEKSVLLAMRCGQDSDCNPSTVGGLLGNLYGRAAIPDKFLTHLRWDEEILFTGYTLQEAVDANVALARDVVERLGGSVEGEGDAATWRLPVQEPAPVLLEQWPLTPNEPPALTASLLSLDDRTASLEATATDADGGLTFQWFFGDLSYADGASVTHTYAAPGTYEALVWASDALGNTSWARVGVMVP
jgi:hypothetical protein